MTNWTQYEVWAEHLAGSQDLIETTASRKEALGIAQKVFNEGADTVTVYEESNDGTYREIKKLSR